MRHRSEVYLIAVLATFALAGVTAWQMHEANMNAVPPVLYPPDVQPVEVPPSASWFEANRGYCNPVDVETRVRWYPAPQTLEGSRGLATCYALAGKIDKARDVIMALPEGDRAAAANHVFAIGHPPADAGDEIAAGPLMELVVEFIPNHYMALYHAGAAAYERGEWDLAEGYLERFLKNYFVEDGWTNNAKRMLEAIAKS